MMAWPIRDETDTALVRFFRRRRGLFNALLWTGLALAIAAFVLAPLARAAL